VKQLPVCRANLWEESVFTLQFRNLTWKWTSARVVVVCQLLVKAAAKFGALFFIQNVFIVREVRLLTV
jgi:hypothetical protein